jgi:phospholipid/cholesterol/gamma-HCH transport system ATP-binding protein
VLFCDEPSAGLDPVTAAGLDRLLIQLKEVFGITLVVVTHELESAFAVADRIALIHRGRVLITGTPDELRRSTDPVVRRFLDRQPAKDGDDGSRFRRWMTEEGADA